MLRETGTRLLSVAHSKEDSRNARASSRRSEVIHSKASPLSHQTFKHMAMGITQARFRYGATLASRAYYRPVDAYDARRQARHGCRCGRCLVSRHDLVDSYQHPPASSPENNRSDCSLLFTTFLDITRHCLRRDPYSAGPQNRSRNCLNRLRPGSVQFPHRMLPLRKKR